MPTTMHQHTTSEMQECIEHCTRCHAICLETVTHCLRKGGRHAEADHIRLQPENEAMEPIRTSEARVLGRVVGVFRKV